MPQSLAQVIVCPSNHLPKQSSAYLAIISLSTVPQFFFFLFKRQLFFLTLKAYAYAFNTMPPKNAVATGAGKNPPAAKRQRTLTNKQQHLGKIYSDLRAY